MSKALQLLILSDGKPGHRNQSLGLAEALARLTTAEYHVIELSEFPRGKKTLSALRIARDGTRPDWIIAAGHGTHFSALCISRILQSRLIVLMKPSWPLSLFDACLLPTHDIKGKSIADNVIATTGALNRIVASKEKEPMGLILIGGSSREFSCDENALRDAIKRVIASQNIDWHITDSRRSPAGFLESLSSLPATLHPHQQTASTWLPQQLQRCQSAWVTQDSVSMIYEALSSGAHVGLLSMPALKSSSKIANAINELVASGMVKTENDLQSNAALLPSVPLAEADRCAKILLDKFPLQSS